MKFPNLGSKAVVFTINDVRTELPTAGVRLNKEINLAEGQPTGVENVYPELAEGETLLYMGEEATLDKTGCGTGHFNYTNCEGETISINRANLQASTFIYTDNDYLGCGIAFVDANCHVGASVRSYCLYGTARFTKIVGGFNAGYTDELALERINWVLCNGDNMSNLGRQNIDAAIWYFTNTNTSCNSQYLRFLPTFY